MLVYLEEVKNVAALRAALEQARRRGIAILAVVGGVSAEGARSPGCTQASTGFSG